MSDLKACICLFAGMVNLSPLTNDQRGYIDLGYDGNVNKHNRPIDIQYGGFQ